MNKSVLKIVFVVLLMSIYSCGNGAKEKQKSTNSMKVEEVENHKGTGNQLDLDEGKLWKATPNYSRKTQ